MSEPRAPTEFIIFGMTCWGGNASTQINNTDLKEHQEGRWGGGAWARKQRHSLALTDDKQTRDNFG